ncbi:hypothetical protein KDA23_03140 [Candidatus Saccharibacteria bacterium]|nr:hypothetical protein [Candidatus Saccharibacteria bacterium]
MENAESILVIITSSVLVIFLVLSIIATIMSIKIMKKVKRVVAKAEDVLDTAEEAAEAFKNVGGKMSFLKVVQNIVSMVNDHKKK